MNKYLVFDIETGGLSPLSSSISCICFKLSEDKGGVVCFASDMEAKVIQDFVDMVEEEGVTHLVTFNGWAFDIPFLRVRAMVCGVKLPDIFWDDSRIVDPFHILARNKSGKQHEFGELFGMKTKGSGLECVGWLQKGDFKSITDHCTSDIFVLDKIFHKMKGSGFLG